MRFFKWSAGFACAAAVIFALTLLTPHHSQAQYASPVRVMNATTDPIPANAAQSGPWTMSISGTPMVSINGSPTVNVATGANTPLFVRDVDNPARSPYAKSLQLQNTCGSQYIIQPGEIPNGQILVIEFVSYIADVQPAGLIPFIGLGIANKLNILLPTRFNTGGTADEFVVSQQTRFYVPPNNGVTVETCFRNNAQAVASNDASFSVSGYLLNP
jgi:hypothetical protein